MSPSSNVASRRSGKRIAIERAALDVFGRLGYEGASIDSIAAEAEVSTRTLYNHFGDKMALFTDVLVGSAAEVADAFVEEVDAGFTGADAEVDVAVLARAVVSHRKRFPKHFLLLQRIGVEVAVLPPAVMDRWRDTGPLRVRSVIVDRLTELGEAGRLTVPDPRLAARHLVALASSEMTEPGRSSPPSEAGLAAAVEVFLRGYAGSSGI